MAYSRSTIFGNSVFFSSTSSGEESELSTNTVWNVSSEIRDQWAPENCDQQARDEQALMDKLLGFERPKSIEKSPSDPEIDLNKARIFKPSSDAKAYWLADNDPALGSDLTAAHIWSSDSAQKNESLSSPVKTDENVGRDLPYVLTPEQAEWAKESGLLGIRM